MCLTGLMHIGTGNTEANTILLAFHVEGQLAEVTKCDLTHQPSFLWRACAFLPGTVVAYNDLVECNGVK